MNSLPRALPMALALLVSCHCASYETMRIPLDLGTGSGVTCPRVPAHLGT
jgi:hypothetical protein